MTVVTEADVLRRVRALSGTPWQHAERLERALAAIVGETRRGARIELGIEITALRRRLAQLFGERHGWRHSRADFAPAVLARRGLYDGHGRRLGSWPVSLIDHPYFFRTSDRRAAGLAAHLYGPSPAMRTEIALWAPRNRLRAVFPNDFPSWWVPGGTSLCVYLPAEEADMPDGR
jgi:hypothetical protein